jgi:uncharacterized protein
LMLTALLMGLVGGPHCLLMCGPTCVGLAQLVKPLENKAPLGSTLLVFHLGRLVGYSSLGAFMGAGLNGLGWLSVHHVIFQPVWSLMHVSAGVLGVLIFVKAKQPTWLTDQAQKLWHRTSRMVHDKPQSWGPSGLFVLGLVWTFLPCGLLYAALGVAALSSNPWEGGLVMLGFALGSTTVLALGPGIWRKLYKIGPSQSIGFLNLGFLKRIELQTWGLRLAGLSLAILSFIALWQALFNNQAPWCAPAP